MKITDLDRLNLIYSGCGCCGFPVCDAGTIKCESRSFTSTCADDDYTDALRIWEEARAVWVNEPITAWQADLEEWLAEDPDREAEDYPVPQPDPRDPDDYTVPEPDKPDGYDDVTHGCYGPYVQPSGLPTDPLPLIYRIYDIEIKTGIINGVAYHYEGFNDAPTVEYEFLIQTTYVDYDGITGRSNVVTGNTKTGDTCFPDTSFGDGWLTFYGGAYSGDLTGDRVLTYDCLPASRVTTSSFAEAIKRTYSSFSADPVDSDFSPPTLIGCPGPFDFYPVIDAWETDISDRTTQTLGSAITKSDLITRAKANIPTGWPDEPEGSLCIAEGYADWPTIGDLMIPGDPDADPPIAARWGTCEEDYLPNAPAQGIAVKVRYKMGVPEKYMAHRLWITTKAEWDACEADTPGECGEDPPEPQIFHYFAKQWDVVKFSKVWDLWRIRWDAWVLATAAHDQWIIDHAKWVDEGSDPDTEPEEPEVPADPTADQPDEANRPQFIDENLSWIWTGGETEAGQYETTWHEIDAPTDEAQVRIVNQQEWCYRIEGQNVPPTYRGEIYNPDDYPE